MLRPLPALLGQLVTGTQLPQEFSTKIKPNGKAGKRNKNLPAKSLENKHFPFSSFVFLP
jgi:hypothetical protein